MLPIIPLIRSLTQREVDQIVGVAKRIFGSHKIESLELMRIVYPHRSIKDLTMFLKGGKE